MADRSVVAKIVADATGGMNRVYADREPTRAAIASLEGPTVIEFGTPWCGYCRAAQSLLVTAFANHSRVRHIKIEDGSGRPLGRSFRVTLWPTLIFLSDGNEVARLVRPTNSDPIGRALVQIDGLMLPAASAGQRLT